MKKVNGFFEDLKNNKDGIYQEKEEAKNLFAVEMIRLKGHNITTFMFLNEINNVNGKQPFDSDKGSGGRPPETY